MAPVELQIMSDLHLETHPSYDFNFPRAAPYLALLGDIGHVEKEGLLNFLERQLSRYLVVFFLFGNHEPYHLSMEFAKSRVKAFTLKMDKKKNKSPSTGRFVFLDQTRYDVDDETTVLGCTLHSRVTAEQARAVSSRLVDFRDILHWDVSEHVDAHLEDVAWLNKEVAEISSNEPGRRILILTHHSPCVDTRANNPKYQTSEVSSGFVTDLSAEECWQNRSVALWAFGHTHFNCDFCEEGGKRVVANQRGYFMFPQRTFEAGKVFNLVE
ncbi:ser Thr phosphatase [Lecanosticta acicola]|uniref:Ser Thr phosphatase n=1 Tax=Lecanosticta acicola TaxID=111012 RepID=A0AAI9EDM4_9PEZI|nr:ser Thr phosphatase [Lecanosticta acicola]